MHIDAMTLEKKSNPIKFSYIIVYLLFLLKAGYVFVETYNSFTAPAYFVLLLIFCFLWNKRIDKSVLIISMLMILNVTLTGIFHGFPGINIYVLTLLNIITAVLLVSIFDKNEFEILYCNVIFAMCIASIIGWILIKLGSPILNLLPTIVNSHGRGAHFGILTMISDFSFTGIQRIQGVFWEPGAFQALIIPAMLIYNYGDHPKESRYRQIVYAIAICLTFSTTGYICLTLVLMLLLNRDTKHFKLFRILLFLFAIILCYVLLSPHLSGFMQYALVDKIQMIFNYQVGVSNAASSRMDSIVLPLVKFIKNPIFGLGVNGYEELFGISGHRMFTCTPVGYLTTYGLPFAVMCFLGFFRTMRSPRMTVVDYCIVVVTAMLAFSSEDFVMNPILSVFMFYGYKNYTTRPNTCLPRKDTAIR